LTQRTGEDNAELSFTILVRSSRQIAVFAGVISGRACFGVFENGEAKPPAAERLVIWQGLLHRNGSPKNATTLRRSFTPGG
jgi:hypothetical protein